MQYHIHINQKAVIDLELNLGLHELAILDFMVKFSQTKRCERKIDGNEIYFWFSAALIIQELPILGINTRQGIAKRIDNLINCKVLSAHKDNQKLAKSWFKFEENCEKIFFHTDEPVNKSLQPCKQKFTPPVNKSLHLPVNESLHYHNTIEHNTKEHILTNKLTKEGLSQNFENSTSLHSVKKAPPVAVTPPKVYDDLEMQEQITQYQGGNFFQGLLTENEMAQEFLFEFATLHANKTSFNNQQHLANKFRQEFRAKIKGMKATKVYAATTNNQKFDQPKKKGAKEMIEQTERVLQMVDVLYANEKQNKEQDEYF
jgi:hypothetical protein